MKYHVTYELVGVIEVEANSEEEAIEAIQDVSEFDLIENAGRWYGVSAELYDEEE